MPVVRCSIHDIPYNPENPRGCPACAREKEGDASADLMRQLAHTSRPSRKVEVPEPEVLKATVKQFVPAWPVTTPPRKPETRQTTIDRLVLVALRRKLLTAGITATVFLAIMLAITTRSRFVPEPEPPLLDDPATVRPLPLTVNVPVSTAFSILGSQPPRNVPDQPGLQRHAYGAKLVVDAINGVVYAIRLGVPSHVWRGLRVGMPQSNARGALAIMVGLDGIRQLEASADLSTREVRGYTVYRSLDVPRRVLGAEVRPPNGCFDVAVTLQPQIVGVLVDGSQRYAVLGPGGSTPAWVVTEIAVVSRSIRGPDARPAVC